MHAELPRRVYKKIISGRVRFFDTFTGKLNISSLIPVIYLAGRDLQLRARTTRARWHLKLHLSTWPLRSGFHQRTNQSRIATLSTETERVVVHIVFSMWARPCERGCFADEPPRVGSCRRAIAGGLRAENKRGIANYIVMPRLVRLFIVRRNALRAWVSAVVQTGARELAQRARTRTHVLTLLRCSGVWCADINAHGSLLHPACACVPACVRVCVACEWNRPRVLAVVYALLKTGGEGCRRAGGGIGRVRGRILIKSLIVAARSAKMC